jgi:hypothetical protein
MACDIVARHALPVPAPPRLSIPLFPPSLLAPTPLALAQVRRGDYIIELQQRVNTYDPFDQTTDDWTKDTSYLRHRPIGPHTVDTAALIKAEESREEGVKYDLLRREFFPFDI